MKTVQQVLRQLDTEKLLETYVYFHPIEFYKLKVMDMPACEIYSRYKDLYREFLKRLRTMEAMPAKDGRQGVLFVGRYLENNIDENTYELIFKDELLEKGMQCESYAYEFTPQAEILSFLVADTPRTQVFIYELMADTMHEAAFFGFQQEELDAQLKRLDEAEKQIEDGEGITCDELSEKLNQRFGWKRHKRIVDENSLEVILRRQAIQTCRAYADHCREQELLLIEAQLETDKQAALQDPQTKLTVEERRELDQAEKKPPVFDDDCPEMTEAQLAQFRRVPKETGADIKMYRLRHDTNEAHHK